MADMDDTPQVESHPIGELAAAMMEVIEREYGEDVKIGLVGIVAQVTFKVGTNDETSTLAWSNIDPPWVQAALFEEGARITRGESS